MMMLCQLTFLCQGKEGSEFPFSDFFQSLLEDDPTTSGGSIKTQQQREFLVQCTLGDPDSISKAAREIMSRDGPLFGKQNIEFGLELYRYCADERSHADSQAKLGKLYLEGIPILSPKRALEYFQQAGEQGHHSSLYNACHIMANGISQEYAELNAQGKVMASEFVERDLIGSLAYCHAAVTLHENYPELADDHITNISLQAMEVLYNTVVMSDLSIREVADAFIFGSNQSLSQDALELWTDAVSSLIRFNETFVDTNGSHQDEQLMIAIYRNLKLLLENHGSNLSDLQIYLALDNLNDFLGPLAGLNDTYLEDAAIYAERLAFSSLCMNRFAVSEGDGACFNGAAASAISYYRRQGNDAGAEHVRLLANQHPHAATHWNTILQTPRVFHPSLTAKPWWNFMDFTAAVSLKDAYENTATRSSILKELETVINLQEGGLRGEEYVVDSSGEDVHKLDMEGVQRIFTPYIGVRSNDKEKAKDGAGGWAEFGPLFDGVNWSKDRCSVVPTLCNILKDDKSLCSESRLEPLTHSTQQKDIRTLCGSGTVVTILRLRPGTSVSVVQFIISLHSLLRLFLTINFGRFFP
jgi:TPR repeat protein